jgi:tRNA 2-thiouridine synthesizing protein A
VSTPETTTLDVRGLNCPLPVLKARKALSGVPAGAVLKVLATDPGSVKDFQHFCEATGHRLLGSGEADGIYSFHIEKKA